MLVVIKSFRGKDAESIFGRAHIRGLSRDIQRAAYRKLVQIHAATVLETLRIPPGNRLEGLRGDRAGQYSIRVNDQWRICFRWREGHAYDVELVDYH
jgi:toxin HigB-1